MLWWGCPSRSRLEQHLSAGEPAGTVARHLARCGRCRACIAQLREELKTLAELRAALEGALPDEESNAVQKACRRALRDAEKDHPTTDAPSA